MQNEPAFPTHDADNLTDPRERILSGGMSLRDWFAGQALPICSGTVPEFQLKLWFGDRIGIKRNEIIAKQAYTLADAMMAAREKTDD